MSTANSQLGGKFETGLAEISLSVIEQTQGCEAERTEYALYQLLTKAYCIWKMQQ